MGRIVAGGQVVLGVGTLEAGIAAQGVPGSGRYGEQAVIAVADVGVAEAGFPQKIVLFSEIAEQEGFQLLLLGNCGFEEVAVHVPQREGQLRNLLKLESVGKTGRNRRLNPADAVAPGHAGAALQRCGPAAFKKKVDLGVVQVRGKQSGRCLLFGKRDLTSRQGGQWGQHCKAGEA